MRSTLKKSIKKFKNDGPLRFCLSVLRTITGYNRYKFLTYSNQFKYVLKLKENRDRFEEIYNKKLWGNGESISGYGSTMEATLAIRSWLIENIPKLSINKIVDAPCGDFHWMQDVVTNISVEYYGYDIVPKLIESNHSNYGTENVTFNVGDICEDKLPECDILLVRDCLFHLSFHDISRFLKNIQHVKFKYLVTTNFKVDGDFINKDIETGDYRPISLLRYPFNFQRNK